VQRSRREVESLERTTDELRGSVNQTKGTRPLPQTEACPIKGYHTICSKSYAKGKQGSTTGKNPSDAVKTEFDRNRDQPPVAQILRAGCTHMLKVF
jgi:hypothetical protein